MSSDPHTPSDAPSRPPRGERRLIQTLASGLALPGAAGIPFGDDMAGLDAGDAPLAWTVDMLMDGVDFDSRTHSWTLIGRKAMAVNLSDCAAMGVAPVAALIALALNNRLSLEDAVAIETGANAAAAAHGCAILGGDTNSWDAPTVISITLAGRPAPGTLPVLRSGGRPGNDIWLSGPVGGSLLGRHLDVRPRIELGQILARSPRATAMIDVSDGVALDLSRICEASGCGAEIDEDLMRAAIHPDAVRIAATTAQPPLHHALRDGEDFELLVALDPRDADAARALGLLPIGRLIAERGLFLRHPDQSRSALEPRGWEHFR